MDLPISDNIQVVGPMHYQLSYLVNTFKTVWMYKVKRRYEYMCSVYPTEGHCAKLSFEKNDSRERMKKSFLRHF